MSDEELLKLAERTLQQSETAQDNAEGKQLFASQSVAASLLIIAKHISKPVQVVTLRTEGEDL